MFSEASVILSTVGSASEGEGGYATEVGSASAGGGGQTPLYWHLVAATAAVGTHPTRMHSCNLISLYMLIINLWSWIDISFIISQD